MSTKLQREAAREALQPGLFDHLYISRVELEFAEWVESPDGRRVEAEAVRRARAVIARGHLRFGVKAIFESIRYDWSVGLLGDGDFRLNNNHTSFMARRLMEKYPDLGGLFELRELRGRVR